MISTTDHSAIGTLVLVRLLVAAETGETNSKIQKDLEPLLAHRWSGVPMTTAVNQAVDELKAAGLVGFLLGKSKKAATKIALTAEGRQRALEVLGVATLKPRTTWGVLRKTYLPASVLGLPASSDARLKAMGSDPIFRAVLLKRQYNLPIAEIPKSEETIDALVWKLIGFEGETRKFNPKNVKAAVLNRELGDGRATDFKKAANRLVARGAGARRDDAKELRDAIIRGWLAAPLEAPPREKPALPMSELAERVKAAARACTTGRYGDNKVFIAHVWRMLRSDPEFAGMDLDTFKVRLAEANNARLLDLGRADLIQAMDPDDVRESELSYLNAIFHFVRI